MLVITANWGFSDGTLAAVPPRAAAAGFRREVRRATVRAGFRRDGRYEPVDGVDVVLAGDTCDWLVSREWTGAERPWHTGPRARAAFARVVAGSLRRAARLAAVLARWSRLGIDVPEADRRGRPVVERGRRVPVRVTLLEGDRDHGLAALAGAGAAALRGRAVAVGTCWSNDLATVRHGAELDPLAAADAGGPTLAASLAVDLVARFGAELAGVTAVRSVAAGLVGGLARCRAVDAPEAIARWLAADGRAAALPPRAGEVVRDAWNRSVAEWHRTARRSGRRGGRGCDLAAALAAWLTLDEHRVERIAAGDAAEPPAILVAADRGLPTPDASLVVLGHPAPGVAGGAAWRGRVVCLGPASAAAVVSAGAAGTEVEWLPSGVRGPTMDGGRVGPVASAVWRSDAGGRSRVLDAA